MSSLNESMRRKLGLTVDGEDGGEDGTGFGEGESAAREKGLEEGAVAVVVLQLGVLHGGVEKWDYMDTTVVKLNRGVWLSDN